MSLPVAQHLNIGTIDTLRVRGPIAGSVHLDRMQTAACAADQSLIKQPGRPKAFQVATTLSGGS
jgi:hypothetical protein